LPLFSHFERCGLSKREHLDRYVIISTGIVGSLDEIISDFIERAIFHQLDNFLVCNLTMKPIGAEDITITREELFGGSHQLDIERMLTSKHPRENVLARVISSFFFSENARFNKPLNS
tara:strand:+ start:1006 stop:1359 length:354 start_codon:yes stop_codon:yes gene_type:complete